MGVLSDLVVSDQVEARQVGECDAPVREWDGIELKTVDPVKLGALWAILTNVSGVDAIVELAGRFPLLYEASDDGPWVYAIPRDLRVRLAELASMEPEEFRSIARRWASGEELRDWEYLDVEAVLQAIGTLADTARLRGNALLLWISL